MLESGVHPGFGVFESWFFKKIGVGTSKPHLDTLLVRMFLNL